MNNITKEIPEVNTDMSRYYDLRKKVRTLYNSNTKVNPRINDFCSKILQLRDKHRCIESINIDTNNFIVELELEDGTSFDKWNKIYNQLHNIVNNYISNNIDGVSDDNDDIEYAKSARLYDEICVGNYIKINL